MSTGRVDDVDVGLESVPPPPYRSMAPVARYFKSVLQMIIGFVAALVVLFQLVEGLRKGYEFDRVQEETLGAIGLALALAAAVELAYTLFTHGPDEALDPVMLALASVLILQLGKVAEFQWTQAVAAALYVAALSALFVVKEYFSRKPCIGCWSWVDNTAPGRWVLQHWRMRFPGLSNIGQMPLSAESVERDMATKRGGKRQEKDREQQRAEV